MATRLEGYVFTGDVGDDLRPFLEHVIATAKEHQVIVRLDHHPKEMRFFAHWNGELFEIDPNTTIEENESKYYERK